MKLWRLTRRDHAGYDEARGFIVRAASEGGARQVAYDSTIDDYMRDYYEENEIEGGEPRWLDESLTICELLTEDGPAEVVLEDFLHG